MQTPCKNCGNETKGHFCNNCGQSTATHRISSHFLWHDIQHGLLHMDKGIIYTTKQLFTRPGHTIREFLEGKRVKHFRPLSLVIVLAGIYGFGYHYLGINLMTAYSKPDRGAAEMLEKMNEWIAAHYAMMELIYLPLYSVASWIAFRKSGYNFMEHLVLNAFLIGQRLILNLVLLPLLYFTKDTPYMATVVSVTSISTMLIIFWGYIQFFGNKVNIGMTIVRSILAYVLFFLMMGILSVSATFAYIAFLK